MAGTITGIELFKTNIALKKPFIISLGPFYHAENVVVRLRTSEGLTGMGECSPFLTIHGESADTAMVVGQLLGGVLKGRDSGNTSELIDFMDAVIYGNNCIKSAFDMALYDIHAQYAGLPLYRLLEGKKDKTLFTDYTVSIGPPEVMAADALQVRNDGFRVIKVKLGGDKKTDVERIRLIREQVGMEIPLRVDANQGWEYRQAIEILQEIHPWNIQFCEEPIRRGRYRELAIVSKESPVPVMADESCCTLTDVQNLLDMEACRMFNIKLGKCGGIFRARQLLRKAEEHQVPVQLSGFLESRLGFTAAAHLALSSPAVQYCDFDTPLMFSADPVTGGMRYGKNWEVEVPESPGLGGLWAEEFLSGLTTIRL